MGDPRLSPGEMGGLFAGLVAVMATIGGAIRWTVGWKERRAETLHGKLLRWEEKLEQREARLDAEQAGHLAAIERRVEKLEVQNEALRDSYHIVSSELRLKEPDNHRLRMADERLLRAFRVDPNTPPDMDAILARLPGGKNG